MLMLKYLTGTNDEFALNIAYTTFLQFAEFANAFKIALFFDDLQHVEQVFTSCDDLLKKKQFCYILARHLDDEMCRVDDDRILLQDIINNSKLSESYLSLARDMQVMEPKYQEEIYKADFLDGHACAGASFGSAGKVLAATFVNAFVNAGLHQDKLMTVPADSSSGGSSGNCKNKEHGKSSAEASLGMILLWDVDFGLAHIHKYIHSNDNLVIAGALLGIGLVNCNVNNDLDPARGILREYIGNEDSSIRIGAIMGLGIAYSGAQSEQQCGGCRCYCRCFNCQKRAGIGGPLTRLLSLSRGLIFLGKQEERLEAKSDFLERFNKKIRKYWDVTLLSCAYAGTRNVLSPVLFKEYCITERMKSSFPYWGPAVLGIAMVAIAEELGLEMSIRLLERLLQYSELNIRRAVPFALGLLCISNPKVNVMDILSRLSHDTDLEVAMAAVISLGLIGAGTNHVRIVFMLGNLSSYYYGVDCLLFCVQIAQG
ncbi:26S proteasome non-ATPase regulatory subunit 2-like protein B [Hibiscus syriacus]|uniref:26S proteasome non-ATPase regulatory subunit 2-like protein B n=1 Tax=Hibiscus syriacus TaxID=106335 RepID=A0A6A3CW79_HIBSY|nr:26S proteasome non-ATPase regulatory subunit 2-like protein B [Hibiscus syriacus]